MTFSLVMSLSTLSSSPSNSTMKIDNLDIPMAVCLPVVVSNSTIIQQIIACDILRYALFIAFALSCYSLTNRIKLRMLATDGHTMPYSIPVLRCTLPFVFDGSSFLKNAALVPQGNRLAHIVFWVFLCVYPRA